MKSDENHTIRLLSGSKSARTSKTEVNNDDELEIQGFCWSLWRVILICGVCLLTGGILLILFYWRRDWALRCTHKRCPVSHANRLLITDKFKRVYVVSVKMIKFDEKKNLICQKNKCSSDSVTQVSDYGSITVSIENLGKSKWIVNQIISKGHVVFFKFKEIRYFWNDNANQFEQISGYDDDVSVKFLLNSQPLSNNEARFRSCLFGSNRILIHIPWISTIFIREALTPFYIFQLFSVILWYFSDYEIYATVIIIMAAFSLAVTVYETRTARVKLHKIIDSESKECVKTVRKNGCVKEKCDNLVPGDIIEIAPEGQPMLCDAVLIDGVCVIDERMLTGESVPVTKTALPQCHDSILFNVKTHAKSTLLRGTRVLQARPASGVHSSERPIRAVVMRTGWQTSKGALLQAILYPKAFDFRFEKDALKFLGIMAMLAVCGMIYSFFVQFHLNLSMKEFMIKSLDIVTIAVPPALPAAMSFGVFFAMRRLKQWNIFCISPSSINMSGDVDTVIFDKTGTLTEEGLIIKCVLPSKEGKFELEIQACNMNVVNIPIIHGMAACHSLNIINGHIFGDPVDTTMFNFTNWALINNVSSQNVGAAFIVRPAVDLTGQVPSDSEIFIFRTFPFESSLQRQSTIVQYKGSKSYTLFVKGSPEMIKSLCRKEALPSNFDDAYSNYAKNGNRIFAVATKSLNIHDEQIYKITREEMEHNLTLVGLIVCENEVKAETPLVIAHLRQANIRTVMATGDNMLTALSVAQSANFFDADVPLYLVEWNAEERRMKYSLVDETSGRCSQNQNLNMYDFEGEKQPFQQRYYFAMTGATWEAMRQNEPHNLQRFALMGVVFARMLSHQKAQIVKALQEIECNVAMCGDGTNDCEALRAANTGVSLSKAEASVACAFTAQKGNIRALIDVIREGRCALVTSFGMFQYMAGYSMIQFISCLILYWIGSNLTDVGFLYIDLVVVLPLCLTFGLNGANPVLDSRKPRIRLLSVYNFVVLGIHLSLAVICMALTFSLVRGQSWYKPMVLNTTKIDVASFEETALFSLSVFQYVIIAVVFAQGLPFRKPLYTNYICVANIVLTVCVSFILLLQDGEPVLKFFQMLRIPSVSFKFILFGIALCNAVLSILADFLLNKGVFFARLRATAPRRFETVKKEIENDCQWPPIEEQAVLSKTKELVSSGYAKFENDRLLEKNSNL